MQDNNKILEPDFKGEKMKMPENKGTIPTTEQPQSSIINGPLLSILALLLILILGGMYYWFSTLKTTPIPAEEFPRPTAEENNEPESTTAEAQTDMTLITSTSDEIESIEADLESTDLESFDTELNAIDAEIESSLR